MLRVVCLSVCLPVCLSAEASPIRTSQLDVRRWVAAGYNAQDAAEFVASFSELINHPNAALAARFPGSPDMAQTVINMALQSLTMPISRVLNNSAVSFAKVINATYVSVHCEGSAFYAVQSCSASACPHRSVARVVVLGCVNVSAGYKL